MALLTHNENPPTHKEYGIENDIQRHSAFEHLKRKTFLMSGSTGLVGEALCIFLKAGGHKVIRLVRTLSRRPEPQLRWDPYAEELNPSLLDGVDAVIHLAGENIASGLWTAEKKRRILNSRKATTECLALAISKVKGIKPALIAASAIGYYADGINNGDENSPKGNSFLSEVVDIWERSAHKAKDAGARVVHLRTGIVLSPKGGALQKILIPFKLGLGGPVGSGDQLMSWILLDDLIYMFHEALMNEKWSGVYNATTTNPVTNKEFSGVLARVLKRPAFFKVPEFLIKLILGEMAKETILSSMGVLPERALNEGFKFSHPELETSLRHCLK